MKTIYIVHIQSESSENYYLAFENKPTKKQLEKEQRIIFDNEGFEDDEYWQDLVSVRKVQAVELK